MRFFLNKNNQIWCFHLYLNSKYYLRHHLWMNRVGDGQLKSEGEEDTSAVSSSTQRRHVAIHSFIHSFIKRKAADE